MIATMYAGAVRIRNNRWFPLAAMLAMAVGLLFSCDPWE